jgi:hypothetical protein
LHNDELRNLYSSPNIVTVDELGGACGTHRGGGRCYRFFVRRPEGKRPLGRPNEPSGSIKGGEFLD